MKRKKCFIIINKVFFVLMIILSSRVSMCVESSVQKLRESSEEDAIKLLNFSLNLGKNQTHFAGETNVFNVLSQKEMVEFVNNLPIQLLRKLRILLKKDPKLAHRYLLKLISNKVEHQVSDKMFSSTFVDSIVKAIIARKHHNAFWSTAKPRSFIESSNTMTTSSTTAQPILLENLNLEIFQIPVEQFLKNLDQQQKQDANATNKTSSNYINFDKVVSTFSRPMDIKTVNILNELVKNISVPPLHRILEYNNSPQQNQWSPTDTSSHLQVDQWSDWQSSTKQPPLNTQVYSHSQNTDTYSPSSQLNTNQINNNFPSQQNSHYLPQLTSTVTILPVQYPVVNNEVTTDMYQNNYNSKPDYSSFNQNQNQNPFPFQPNANNNNNFYSSPVSNTNFMPQQNAYQDYVHSYYYPLSQNGNYRSPDYTNTYYYNYSPVNQNSDHYNPANQHMNNYNPMSPYDNNYNSINVNMNYPINQNNGNYNPPMNQNHGNGNGNNNPMNQNHPQQVFQNSQEMEYHNYHGDFNNEHNPMMENHKKKKHPHDDDDDDNRSNENTKGSMAQSTYDHYSTKAVEWWDKLKSLFHKKHHHKGHHQKGHKDHKKHAEVTTKIFGVSISVLAFLAFATYILMLLFQAAVTSLNFPLLSGIIGLLSGDGGAALVQFLLGRSLARQLKTDYLFGENIESLLINDLERRVKRALMCDF